MNIVRNICTLLVLLTLGVSTLSAQRASSLIITEVMTQNKSSVVDEHGNHSPWVEIYNSSPATVDLKGCYITDDPNNLKKHRIPMWSANTKIGARQYMLLWLDGDAKKGILHLGFNLNPSSSNFLALVDADGKSIISEVSIPVIPEDHSYKAIGVTDKDGNNSNSDWEISSTCSPFQPNCDIETSSKVDNLEKMDPTGIVMTLTAVAVVFIALITLAIVFSLIGKSISSKNPIKKNKEIKFKSKSSNEVEAAISLAIAQSLSTNNEHIAVISMAIRQASIIHDDTNMKLTIRRRSTPWNDKSCSFRKYDY